MNTIYEYITNRKSAQQVDAPEPATMIIFALQHRIGRPGDLLRWADRIAIKDKLMKYNILFIIILITNSLNAQDIGKLTMSSAIIVDSKNPRSDYVIIINENMAFKTTDGFIKYIRELKHVTEITWSPGCVRCGDEPFLSSEKDMKLLKTTLEECKIKFTLVPSG